MLLDDLNTMRFIDLVEGMSQRVQFVYLSLIRFLWRRVNISWV